MQIVLSLCIYIYIYIGGLGVVRRPLVAFRSCISFVRASGRGEAVRLRERDYA